MPCQSWHHEHGMPDTGTSTHFATCCRLVFCPSRCCAVVVNDGIPAMQSVTPAWRSHNTLFSLFSGIDKTRAPKPLLQSAVLSCAVLCSIMPSCQQAWKNLEGSDIQKRLINVGKDVGKYAQVRAPLHTHHTLCCRCTGLPIDAAYTVVTTIVMIVQEYFLLPASAPCATCTIK